MSERTFSDKLKDFISVARVRVSAFEAYDEKSKRKDRVTKGILSIQIILMITVFIAFAVYDSQNRLVSVVVQRQVPFPIPNIIMYAPFSGWSPSRCFYEEISRTGVTNKTYECADVYSMKGDDQGNILFSPYKTVPFERFRMLYPVPCPVEYLNDNLKTTTKLYFKDSLNATLNEEVFAACLAVNNFVVHRQIYNYADGSQDIYYVTVLQSSAPVLDETEKGFIYLTFYTDVQTTTEETSLGLAKRIITDAGGLLSIVFVITALIEYITVRVMFDEFDLYYPHALRETVLWLVDPSNKKRKFLESVSSSKLSTVGIEEEKENSSL